MSENTPRDKAINVRIDLLTEDEQEQLSIAIKKAKKQIAPDARGTIVEGDMKTLPSQKPTYLPE